MVKILILEDDYELAHYWRRSMPQYKFDIAFSSSEAISYDTNDTYDLYIVDLMIGQPGDAIRDTGQTFLKHLGALHSMEEVGLRTVGVTGFMANHDPVFGTMIFASYEVKDVLRKPFPPVKLSRVLENKISALQTLEDGRRKSQT